MERIDFISVASGAVAMMAVGLGAMASGYEGMSFAQPWPSLLLVGLVLEVLLMRWMGPLPALLLTSPLFALARRRPRWAPLAQGLLQVLIFLTAVGVALLLLRLGLR